MDELKQIYEYYLEMTKDENLENSEFYGVYSGIGDNRIVELSRRVFGYMVDLKGFNKFPALLKDINFIFRKGRTLYHGFKEFDHGAQFLNDWNYHYGIGVRSSGFYLTNLKMEAKTFTVPIDSGRFADGSKIMSFKLSSKKGVKIETLDYYKSLIEEGKTQFAFEEDREKLTELYTFFNELKPKKKPKTTKEEFKNIFLKNLGNIAVYLGYEYIVNKPQNFNDLKGYIGTYTIVLNRGALVADQKENEIFIKNSNKYENKFKDNFINCDKLDEEK